MHPRSGCLGLSLSLLLGIALALPGCRSRTETAHAAGSPVATEGRTPGAVAADLIAQNHLREHLGPEGFLYPRDEPPAALRVSQHTWGISVGWQKPRNPPGIAPVPLLFDTSGHFICRALGLATGDVTGDAVEDLVAVQQLSCGQYGYFMYPGGRNAPPARYLGGRLRLWQSPRLVDFNGDGVLEVVTVQDQPLLSPEIKYAVDVNELIEHGLTRYVTVWSLKYGLPHLLLAFIEGEYEIAEGPEPGCHRIRIKVPPKELLVDHQPQEVEWRELTWDRDARKFRVPDLKGTFIYVIINRPLLR